MSKQQIIGQEIERLIKLLGKLPGLGPRSARRAVLHLLKNREGLLEPLIHAIEDVAHQVMVCSKCGNIDTVSPCFICTDPTREEKALVIVKDVGDLWALERAQAVKGRYHVLGGLLSPLDGIGPDKLSFGLLQKRFTEHNFVEVILALDATVEGQATAHYITELLKPHNLQITRLAYGMPIGGELDYMDEGTLLAALKQRTHFET